ncbi:MAG: bifunctional diaminohydroxyphosphoribosylaminopyrimidine deaminase/5-amino-6-(5-phosphoribosylamino)uracil reductase RibD [Nitrospirae bacterium]|nr:bifunctional diaminohydroxyphosphoribosylaminopyrimidine deaminase/5-amino-6-(5-phosphoribosylamino)uracil reductase RibD [Nitrospirota bacterium]
MNDEFYMKRALKLASKAHSMASPNPMVGAVLVKKNKIVSEDFHKKPGTPHAEALAIEKAGEDARDCTLFVNLEPCCHTEKRTPPCTKAIIFSKIKEVVIAMVDPNPMVSGKGIAELRKAGIHVRTGILENEARRLNEAYIKYITKGIPFVIMKIAMTIDGKIATPEGKSKWITSEKSRKMVHRLRSSVVSVLTAIGTVKADDPELTARIRGGKNPLRIIIDPDLEIPLDSKVIQIPPQTVIVTKKFHGLQSDNEEKIKLLLNKGVEFIEYEGEKVDLKWLMKRLCEKEITSVLIEAGSSFNANALEQGIVDKIMFFIAPKIIGGRESFPAVGGRNFKKLEEAYRLKDIKIKRIGEDILVEGYIEK